MSSAALVSVFVAVFYVVWFLVGGYVYVALIRQISARTIASPDAASAKTFGLPEAVVAFFLISLMLVNVVASVSTPSIELRARDLSIN